MRSVIVAITLCACGDSAVDDVLITDGAAFDSTTGDGGGDASVDVGVDVTKFNGGGPFLCGNCVCDGTLNLCFSGRGSGGMFVGDASMCAPSDAGAGCIPIPVDCLPKPTCECLAPLFVDCACFVDSTGNGLSFICPEP